MAIKKKSDHDSRGKFKKGNIAALKSGAHSFKMTGRVPAISGRKALRTELDKIKAGLEAATSGMNVKKSLLIDQIVKARGFMRLWEMYVSKYGVLNARMFLSNRKTLDFQPGFKTYVAMAAQQHKALMALGLDTETADKVMDLDAYVEKKYGGKAK